MEIIFSDRNPERQTFDVRCLIQLQKQNLKAGLVRGQRDQHIRNSF